MPFTSCKQTASGGGVFFLFFTPFFIIIIYHVFLISFLFYTGNVLYYGTTAFQKLYFWEPVCTELPIYQSVHFYWIASLQRSHFFFYFSLVTFFFNFKLLVFASFDTEMLCGTTIILHWTSQKHSSLLFSKEQTCWKKWKLRQTSDDRTEQSIEYMWSKLHSLKGDHCYVDRNVRV